MPGEAAPIEELINKRGYISNGFREIRAVDIIIN